MQNPLKMALTHLKFYCCSVFSRDVLWPENLKVLKHDEGLMKKDKNTMHGQLLNDSERCQDMMNYGGRTKEG